MGTACMLRVSKLSYKIMTLVHLLVNKKAMHGELPIPTQNPSLPDKGAFLHRSSRGQREFGIIFREACHECMNVVRHLRRQAKHARVKARFAGMQYVYAFVIKYICIAGEPIHTHPEV